jgi:antitoxin component YwqK of YwqJK toxin-antitoxin module
MKTYFEYSDKYSNTSYIDYVKENEGKSIDSIYYEEGKESGFIVKYIGDEYVLYKIGLWITTRKNGSIISYSFYTDKGTNTGPNWTYRKDGSIIEKMWWHQTQKPKLKHNFKPVSNYEFYSVRFYKNGGKKSEGDFIDGLRNGLWKYYNKSGEIIKEKQY